MTKWIPKIRLRVPTWSLIVCIMTAIVSTIFIGGVHAVTHTFAAITLLIALSLLLLHRYWNQSYVMMPRLSFVWLVAGLLTFIQIVPLPSVVVDIFSPASVTATNNALQFLPTEFHAWLNYSISRDKTDSSMALFRIVCCLCTLIIVADRSRHRKLRNAIMDVFFIMGLVVVGISILHQILQWHQIYGLYGNPTSILYGPFVNPNHQARFLGSVSLMAVASVPLMRTQSSKLFTLLTALVTGIGVILTLSRGGILSYSAGILFFMMLNWQSSSTFQEDVTLPRILRPTFFRTWGVMILFMVVIVVSILIADYALWAEVDSLKSSALQQSKITLYEPAWRMAKAYPLLGVGNGAVSVAFPEFLATSQAPTEYTYTDIENIVLATLAHMGFLGAGILIILSLLFFLPLFSSLNKIEVRPYVVSLFFILTGELFDFYLDTLSGALWTSMIIALWIATSARGRQLYWPLRASVVGLGVLFCFVLIFLFVPRVWNGQRHGLDPVVQQALRSSTSETQSILSQAIALHPSDAQYWYWLAVKYRLENHPDLSLKAAANSLELWPHHRSAHHEAARSLLNLKRPHQALLEYRSAWHDDNAGRAVLEEMASRVKGAHLREYVVQQLHPSARRHLCHIFLKENRLQDAQHCYTLAEEEGAMDAHTLATAMRVQRELQLYDKGFALYGRYPQWHQQGVVAMEYVQLIHLQKGLAEGMKVAQSLLPIVQDSRLLLHWLLDSL